MKVFHIGIIILSLWQICKAQSSTQIGQEDVSLDYGELLQKEEFLDEILDEMAEESIIALEIYEPPETACSNVTLGAEFEHYFGTILQNLATNDMSECCEACQELERCTTWSRNRNDGYCMLYEMERVSFSTDSELEIDIGGIIELQEPVEIIEVNETQGSATSPGARRPDVAADFVASQQTVIPECARTRGVVYPRGNVIATGRTPSPEFCCELCRSSSGCSSWYFNRREGICVLNRNVPPVTRLSFWQFEGGTTIN